MTTVVGGLRTRFIRDSTYNMLHDGLDQLGWFAASPNRATVHFPAEPVANLEAITPTTIILADTGSVGRDAEMGSNLTEDTWTLYVDVYAEDDTIGKHLAYDIRDILRAKMPSIGRTRPVVEVFDLSQDPPVSLFFCEIEDVIVDRAAEFPESYRKHWYAVRFDLIDSYGDEDD